MPDMPILKVIRRHCLQCQGGAAQEVRLCNDVNCALFAWRMAGTHVIGEEQVSFAEVPLRYTPSHGASSCAQLEAITPLAGFDSALCTSHEDGTAICCAMPSVKPLRAIRRFCFQCCGNREQIRACDAKSLCALWSYRFGVQPQTYKRVKARLRGERMMTLFDYT